MSEEFDDIRLKELEELTDEDKQALRDHTDDLTDEEKETFKDVLEEKKEEPEFKFGFKTQEELDTYIAGKVAEATKDKPVKEEEEEEETTFDKPFFDKEWKPKDWEEFAQAFFPKVTERWQEMTQAQKSKQTEELNKINEGFDQEIEDLRKGGESIPEKGSKERTEFDRELAQIGIKYSGVTNMKEAYDIFKALKGSKPKTKEEGEKEEEEEGESEEEDTRRKTASRVGTGGGSSGGETKPKKYSYVAGRSRDQAIEAATKKFQELS